MVFGKELITIGCFELILKVKSTCKVRKGWTKLEVTPNGAPITAQVLPVSLTKSRAI